MPTYEYECMHCGHKFEFSQKITDRPLEKCPKCKQKVKRLIGSGSGIIFKGSGFYATDYRKNPKTDTANLKKQNTPCSPGKGCDGCQAGR